MQSHLFSQDELDPKTREFYCQALTALSESHVPFLVGGAYAFERYTGIARHTKDLDIFVLPSDCDRVFAVLSEIGCSAELSFPHWLGKVFYQEKFQDNFIDIIFNSAHGNSEVDEAWFEHAVEEKVFDLPVKLCPAEEIICSKAFVMARDRYDGADIAHLLRACSENLDWSRLLYRFGSHWRVLLSHLILFGFIYPAERSRIPNSLMHELLDRIQKEMYTAPATDQLCQGTLLSGLQYQIDIERWGYEDARLQPRGNMTAEEIALWTTHLKKNTNA